MQNCGVAAARFSRQYCGAAIMLRCRITVVTDMSNLAPTLTLGLIPFGQKLRNLIAGELAALRIGMAHRELYRREYCALQSLSDAELANQALSRSEIQGTAHRRAMAMAVS